MQTQILKCKLSKQHTIDFKGSGNENNYINFQFCQITEIYRVF